MKKISLIALLLAICSIGVQLFILATTKTENTDDDYRKALVNNYKVLSTVLPDTVTFAGEPLPMDIFYARESLDRALLMHIYWQSNTVLLMKRASRHFPVIEEILRKNNVPQDFKYLCVAESGLLNVSSPAQAQGYWQFIKSTGQKFNLEINDEVDERNSLIKSTEAACLYLKSLYGKFGSWTLAAAAYNCGDSGLQRQMNQQKVTNYYDLYLNRETAFYIYRIVGYKLIMESPQEYGFFLRKKDMYAELPYRTVTVDSTINNLYDFAIENRTSYKMLKEFNPWLTDNKLTNKAKKTYIIQLPVKNGIYQTTVQKDNSTEAIKCL